MDWKMTEPVNVNVAVHEDAGTNYTIRIYDANPLEEGSSAKLLAEGIANNKLDFVTTMDCPTATGTVFVCRLDAHNRTVVKYVSVKNSQVNVAFGSTTKTRAADSEVAIEKYSPKVSESEVKNMLGSAIKLDSNTDMAQGKIYYIPEGEIFKAQLKRSNGWGGRATLIVCGSWTPNGNNLDIPFGINIYVVNKGEINIPKDKSLIFKSEQGYLGVYTGGKIAGNNSNINLSQNSGGDTYFYNAGTIEGVNLSTATSTTTTVYNCGVMDIDVLKCLHFINQGHAECKETISVNGKSILVENGCNLKIGTINGDLKCGPLSNTKIEKFNMDRSGWGATTTIGSNALLEIELGSFTGKFSAPSPQYTLVRIAQINDISEFSTEGNIYYELKKIINLADEWRLKFLEALQNGKGGYSKWGESPIMIPSGDCTGDGYKPNEEGTGTPSSRMKYTYVFEDNYPQVGDYDFNDIVLDVSYYYKRASDSENPNNNIQSIHMDVTLAAAGAGKELGAGLRIMGMHMADVDNIKIEDPNGFQKSLPGSFFTSYYGTNTWFDDTKGIVIPIFGDAHRVFSQDFTTSSSQLKRFLYNTYSSTEDAKNGATTYTYKIEITLKDKSHNTPKYTKDQFDFFIGYRYKNMQKRVEVHLYEFMGEGATKGGTILERNFEIAQAGNNTWAICVPNFRYPKEKVNISVTSNRDEGAYPLFIDWAKDRTKNTDWYKYPNEDKVCR